MPSASMLDLAGMSLSPTGTLGPSYIWGRTRKVAQGLLQDQARCNLCNLPDPLSLFSSPPGLRCSAPCAWNTDLTRNRRWQRRSCSGFRHLLAIDEECAHPRPDDVAHLIHRGRRRHLLLRQRGIGAVGEASPEGGVLGLPFDPEAYEEESAAIGGGAAPCSQA